MTVFHAIAAVFGLGFAADAALILAWPRLRGGWAGRVRQLRERPWSFSAAWPVLVAAVTLHGLAVSGGMALAGLRPGERASSSATMVGLQLLLFHVGSLAFVFLALKWRGQSWFAAFGGGPRRWMADLALGVLGYLALFPVFTACTVLYRLGLDALGYPVTPQDVVFLFGDGSQPLGVRVLFIGLTVSLVPLIEEVLFRGVAFAFLSRHLSVAGAAMVVALAFAAVHFHVASFVPLFVLAVGLSLGYLVSGSILVPVTMHAISNAVSVALFCAGADAV
jgi:membrane protease YdiL (CAAX protease family)